MLRDKGYLNTLSMLLQVLPFYQESDFKIIFCSVFYSTNDRSSFHKNLDTESFGLGCLLVCFKIELLGQSWYCHSDSEHFWHLEEP